MLSAKWEEVAEKLRISVCQAWPLFSATLRNLVVEFVTREWSELTDGGSSLERKIEQVLRQLKEGKVLIVFDLTSETCNLVPKESLSQQQKER